MDLVQIPPAPFFAKFAQEGIDKLPAFYKKVIQPIDYLYPNEVNVKKYTQLFHFYQKFAKSR